MSQPPADRLILPPQVVTGEAVALELRPASFATRALAVALDLVLMLGAGIIVGIVLGLTLPDVDEAAARAIGILALVGVLVGLPTAVETLSRGRSLGKLAAGLRVVRDDGGPIRLRHALVRALLAVFEIILTFGSIALITSLANVRGKRLGDLLAGTFVLRERGGALPPPLPPMPPELMAWAQQADLAAVPDGLAVGVRRFLDGAPGLHPASRVQLGQELARQVLSFVAPPPPAWASPERFLVAVLAERRRRDLARLAKLQQDRGRRLAERRRAPVLAPTAQRLVGDPEGAADEPLSVERSRRAGAQYR
jgi:uncharacterized RDD family membrane protein YckC